MQNNETTKQQVYIIGDVLRKGNILLRQYEAKVLRALNLPLYSAIEQKDINDKSNMTEEFNNGLAERIVEKDTNAIRKATLLIADVDNGSIGSLCEISQVKEMNWFNDKIRDIIIRNTDFENGQTDGNSVVKELMHLIDVEVPKKEIHFHSNDIRDTNLKESSYRRSHSYNQYAVGICLALNPDGILTFRDIIKKIIDKHINVPAKNFIKDVLDTDAILGELDLQKIKELTHNEDRR